MRRTKEKQQLKVDQTLDRTHRWSVRSNVSGGYSKRVDRTMNNVESASGRLSAVCHLRVRSMQGAAQGTHQTQTCVPFVVSDTSGHNESISGPLCSAPDVAQQRQVTYIGASGRHSEDAVDFKSKSDTWGLRFLFGRCLLSLNLSSVAAGISSLPKLN